jgi:hypothetical protein
VGVQKKMRIVIMGPWSIDQRRIRCALGVRFGPDRQDSRTLIPSPKEPPMKRSTALQFVLIVTLALANEAAQADERPDHFEGKASETLAQAIENFTQGNASVEQVLAQDEIGLRDMARIHELTYTLENALERIDEEYDRLEEQLEALHLATEGGDTEQVRALGEAYLDNAWRFSP